MARRVGEALLAALAVMTAGAQTVEYNRDIRPILSDRCFACHGPDSAHRMAGLRLDVEGGAKAIGDKLLRRIAAENTTRMPPPSSGKEKLSAKEIELLREW